MFIPLFSAPRSKSQKGKRDIYRRKGGGGGGGRGGGSSSGGRSGSSGGTSSGRGGSSGGSSSGGSGSGRSSVNIGSGASTGGRTTATPYASGGGPITTIPSGQLFSGRSLGGGTRDGIYGTRTYGSGYPGITSRGVSGLGFPFYFWPVVWGSTIGAGTVAYLHSSEYGDASNSSRPGGVLVTVPFSSSSQYSNFHLIADNATVTSLLGSITSTCSSNLNSNSTGSQNITAYNPNSNDTSTPRPEQAVQYYRASSIVLTLDGYNDTAALNPNATSNATDTPLPSWVDQNLLSCLNTTIGAAAPLVDASTSSGSECNMGIPGVLWLMIGAFVATLI